MDDRLPFLGGEGVTSISDRYKTWMGVLSIVAPLFYLFI